MLSQSRSGDRKERKERKDKETKKRRKKDKKKGRDKVRDREKAKVADASRQLLGAVDQDAFGKWGILKESDYFNKAREFEVRLFRRRICLLNIP